MEQAARARSTRERMIHKYYAAPLWLGICSDEHEYFTWLARRTSAGGLPACTVSIEAKLACKGVVGFAPCGAILAL